MGRSDPAEFGIRRGKNFGPRRSLCFDGSGFCPGSADLWLVSGQPADRIFTNFWDQKQNLYRLGWIRRNPNIKFSAIFFFWRHFGFSRDRNDRSRSRQPVTAHSNYSGKWRRIQNRLSIEWWSDRRRIYFKTAGDFMGSTRWDSGLRYLLSANQPRCTLGGTSACFYSYSRRTDRQSGFALQPGNTIFYFPRIRISWSKLPRQLRLWNRLSKKFVWQLGRLWCRRCRPRCELLKCTTLGGSKPALDHWRKRRRFYRSQYINSISGFF